MGFAVRADARPHLLVVPDQTEVDDIEFQLYDEFLVYFLLRLNV